MKPRSLSREECVSHLSSSRYGRLCLSLNDQPYAVPMSYVYSEGVIYLHSRGGGEGKKVEYATGNPRVCFQVDSLSGEKWSSVLAYGIASLSSDVAAKMKMFEIFTKKGIGGHGVKQFKAEDLERMPMTIWEIRVEEMTGKEGIW